MGGSELLGPIFFGLIFLILFLLGSKKPKKKEGYFAEMVAPKKQPPSPLKKAPFKQRDLTPAFKVRKKQPVLQKGWNTRPSLKQAFILSEVFKRYDER